jgi:transposase
VGRPSKYSQEFKRDAAALVRSSGRPINQVARELSLSHETLRSRARRDRIDRGDGQRGELTSDQLEELRCLRRQVKELEAEREILRKQPPICQGDGQVSRLRFILRPPGRLRCQAAVPSPQRVAVGRLCGHVHEHYSAAA